MITVGQNPEGLRGINKFLGGNLLEGMRGKIIALSTDRKQAIVLAINSSLDGSVKWGCLYLIREHEDTKWPVMVDEVPRIPNTLGWEIVNWS